MYTSFESGFAADKTVAAGLRFSFFDDGIGGDEDRLAIPGYVGMLELSH